MTCSVALMSFKKLLYHFDKRVGGSGDEHRTFSVCRRISWHLAFSDSRVVVFWMIASWSACRKIFFVFSLETFCVCFVENGIYYHWWLGLMFFGCGVLGLYLMLVTASGFNDAVML